MMISIEVIDLKYLACHPRIVGSILTSIKVKDGQMVCWLPTQTPDTSAFSEKQAGLEAQDSIKNNVRMKT